MSTLEKPSESWGLIVVIIVVGCLISAVIFVARSHQVPGNKVVAVTPTSMAISSVEPFGEDVSVAIVAGDPTLGEATAPVTVVEFSDFTCSACRQFHQSTFADLKNNYIDTGKVRFVYKDFPVGDNQQNAEFAAKAARCAGVQSKFWEYSEQLFQTPVLSDIEQLINIAKDKNLSITDFTSCLNDRAQANVVAESTQDAIMSGITSAPSFVINGKLYEGSLSYVTLQGIIESLQPTPSP